MNDTTRKKNPKIETKRAEARNDSPFFVNLPALLRQADDQ